MSRYLDTTGWRRENHFELFRRYERPFFNICANVDVTSLRASAKNLERSFFLSTLFVLTRAANNVEPFRYRLRGDRVWIHDRIHAGSTVLLPGDTFGFAYFDFAEDFESFYREAADVLAAIRSGKVDAFDPRDDRDDLVHFSVIPWISFTSFSHARRFSDSDSTPKIVVGKYFEKGERLLMPISVEVHHALVDGIHVGAYFDSLQRYIDAFPEAAQ